MARSYFIVCGKRQGTGGGDSDGNEQAQRTGNTKKRLTKSAGCLRAEEGSFFLGHWLYDVCSFAKLTIYCRLQLTASIKNISLTDTICRQYHVNEKDIYIAVQWNLLNVLLCLLYSALL